MEHDQLFTELNVGTVRQMSLSAKVREKEIESLKAQLLVKEAEAAEAIRLRAEAFKFEVVERSLLDEAQVLKERTTTLKKEKSELKIKMADLVASVKVREQEVADLDVVVTSVKSQNDSLVDQVHGLETSSVGLQEKVTAYESYIDQLEKFQDDKMKEAVEKGMQDGLSAGITHGAEGRNLTDVTAYNPFAKTDYISALQRLQSVNFSLIAKLRSNKDASVETIMNLLRLDDTLAEKLGLTESQPHVNQLVVPIHRSPDQTVVGATALSLSLDVSYARVQKIRENIANHRSALRDIFIPLAEPLSSVALEGMEDTSGTDPNTTTALSVTFASVSSIPPNLTDNYEVVHADGQGGVGADANPFFNVDDAELNIQ
ncbi:hypothetical protein Tco_1424972 [Tanacetum coccineum]